MIGSSLYTLRNGASVPSSRWSTGPWNGPPSAPLYPASATAAARPADSRSQAAYGMLRRASPYRPLAAAMAPAMIAIGVLTRAQPAGSHGVPRFR